VERRAHASRGRRSLNPRHGRSYPRSIEVGLAAALDEGPTSGCVAHLYHYEHDAERRDVRAARPHARPANPTAATRAGSSGPVGIPTRCSPACSATTAPGPMTRAYRCAAPRCPMMPTPTRLPDLAPITAALGRPQRRSLSHPVAVPSVSGSRTGARFGFA
jgi:hypothetical protein